ncbi:MAG: hypothetical protein K2Z81_28780, partial [Cyanobacteria bacterium]|nr:hypothetical protein [Cyanobacteriota bacterium]
DIPESLRTTPIAELISCHNFYEVTDMDSDDKADLIIGMCVDYRKQLHIPKNAAYVIRSPGANMRDCEFGISLGLSAGLKYMALIVHNRCLMEDPFEKRDLVLNCLTKEHGWTDYKAETFFDRVANEKEINDPIDFVIEESGRLRTLFKSLTVVPLLYNVDNDRLYLVNDGSELVVETKPVETGTGS